MSLFRRVRITRLHRQLLAVQAGLCQLESNERIIPSPAEMMALEEMQHLLPSIIQLCETYEPKAWQRIEAWRSTPYPKPVRYFQAAISFIVAWLFGIFAFHAGGLWVLDKFLPMPTSIIISAGLSLIAVTLYFRSGGKGDSKR